MEALVERTRAQEPSSDQGLERMSGPDARTLAPAPDLKQTQELLTDLLNLPVTDRKMETLRDGLMNIAQKFLDPMDRPSTYQVISALDSKREDLLRENCPLARTLGMISLGLKDGESQFESLASYHRYRGDELISRTEGLYAATILNALSISAAQTGEFGYLKGLLESKNPSLLLSTHIHVTDLAREMADSRGEPRFNVYRAALGDVVKKGLKGAVERDLILLVSELALPPYLESKFTACLNQSPQLLPELLKRELKNYDRGNGRDRVELFSDRLDQSSNDLRTFRGYAVRFAVPGSYSNAQMPLLELYATLAS